jgi:hypothetical protein
MRKRGEYMLSDFVIAAISLTGSGFKIAFADPDDILLDRMEFENEEIYQLMHYLTEQQESYNDLRVIGCPYDQWTLSLVKILEGYGHKLRWVDPELTRQVMRHTVDWNRRRQYHRARTLGHLYRLNDEHFILDPLEVALNWERKVAQENFSKCD